MIISRLIALLNDLHSRKGDVPIYLDMPDKYSAVGALGFVTDSPAGDIGILMDASTARRMLQEGLGPETEVVQVGDRSSTTGAPDAAAEKLRAKRKQSMN